MPTITKFISLSLSIDEDSYCISFDAVLADPEEWVQCTSGNDISFILNGTTFNCVIDDRERTREFGEVSYSISGRSVTAKLGEGNATQLYTEWDADETAQSIVQSLCDDYSITLDWNIVDWLIPANTLVVEGEYPIEIIRKIAEAAGAIPQTTPEGTLKIQYRYPITPAHYNDAENTPDIQLDDSNDIIKVSESKELKSLYNAVILMNKDLASDATYSIEAIDYDYQNKTVYLAVRVHPFVDSIDLYHAGDPSLVAIENLGVVSESVEETVEIVEGEGSVSKPIYSIDSSSYNWTDLGAIEFDDTNLFTNVIGESLLDITYTTKYHKFKVTHDERTATLFYTEE